MKSSQSCYTFLCIFWKKKTNRRSSEIGSRASNTLTHTCFYIFPSRDLSKSGYFVLLLLSLGIIWVNNIVRSFVLVAAAAVVVVGSASMVLLQAFRDGELEGRVGGRTMFLNTCYCVRNEDAACGLSSPVTFFRVVQKRRDATSKLTHLQSKPVFNCLFFNKKRFLTV